MRNSEYSNANARPKLLSAGLKYNNAPQIADLTAYYYGMIEEVDHWVGRMLQIIKDAKIYRNTMVVFTSDHGSSLFLLHFVCPWAVLLLSTIPLTHSHSVPRALHR